MCAKSKEAEEFEKVTCWSGTTAAFFSVWKFWGENREINVRVHPWKKKARFRRGGHENSRVVFFCLRVKIIVIIDGFSLLTTGGGNGWPCGEKDSHIGGGGRRRRNIFFTDVGKTNNRPRQVFLKWRWFTFPPCNFQIVANGPGKKKISPLLCEEIGNKCFRICEDVVCREKMKRLPPTRYQE